MTLDWSSDLETGNRELDRQHEEIFGGINSLIDAIIRGAGKD